MGALTTEDLKRNVTHATAEDGVLDNEKFVITTTRLFRAA